MKRKHYIILSYNRITNQYCGYHEPNRAWGLNEMRVKLHTVLPQDTYVAPLDKKRLIERFYNAKTRAEFIYRSCKEDAENLNEGEYRRGFKFKVFRVGSKNCPVSIDWNERVLMKRKLIKYSRYNWLNPKFKIKEDVNF